MTTPFWCLLVAVLIPYVLAGVGGYLKTQQFGSLDNEHPRDQAAQLEAGSAGRRAVAAQQNAWEALAVFTAAVVVAHLAGASEGSAATAAIVFVVARIAHASCYVAGLATARSLSFLVATVSCLWLFGLAITA
jgi:uncharacterized MAPEG superfamily protein